MKLSNLPTHLCTDEVRIATVAAFAQGTLLYETYIELEL